MATVTSLGITFNTNAGAKTVVATPAVGDVIVVVVANTGRTTAQPGALTDDNTDGHGTYQLVSAATATKATSADTMWVYIRADSIQKAVSTTWTLTPLGGGDSGGGLQVFKITGMSITSLAAVRQAAVANNGSAAGTPGPVLGVAALTGNPLIGAVFNATNPAGMTAPANFTESQDVGYNTPTTGLETVLASSGVTASTITWGSTSGSAFCATVVELDASAPFVDPEQFQNEPAGTAVAVVRAAYW